MFYHQELTLQFFTSLAVIIISFILCNFFQQVNKKNINYFFRFFALALVLLYLISYIFFGSRNFAVQLIGIGTYNAHFFFLFITFALNLIVSKKLEVQSGSSISGNVTIEASGSTLFEVIGSEGTIFSLEDSLSGSLFSVGDISGLPQFEIFSDGKIVGDEGVATLRTQRPMVTHTTDFNITSSLDFAGKYHIVGGNLTCSIDTGSLIPLGSELEFFQTSSTNNFLFETASHVDLIVKNDNFNLAGRGSGATLKYITGSTFHLVGDLT